MIDNQELRLRKLEDAVSDLNLKNANLEKANAVNDFIIKSMAEDIKDTKGNTTWIVRLIIAGVVAAILTLVFNNGGKF